MIHLVKRVSTHDVSTNTAGTVLRCLSRMVIAIVLARSFAAHWFGIFTILIGIETLLICVVSSLCTSPVSLIASGRSDQIRAATMRAGDRMQLYLTAMIVLMAAPLLVLLPVEHQVLLIAFPCSLVACAAFNARRTDSTASFKSGRLLIAEVLISLGCIGSLFIPASTPELRLSLFWITQASIMCVSSILIDPNRSIKRSPKRLSSVARRMILQKGFNMLSGTIALSLQNRIQPILVAVVLGPIGAGMYGAMNMFAAPLRLISVSIRSVYLPRVSKKLRLNGTAPLILNDLALLVVGITMLTLLCVCLIPFAPMIVRLVLGNEYIDSSNALPIAIMGAGLGLISTTMVCEMQALGRINLTARYRWISALVSLALLMPLMSTLGISGVFAAIVIGELIMIVSLYSSLLSARLKAQTNITRHGGALHVSRRSIQAHHHQSLSEHMLSKFAAHQSSKRRLS